MRGESDSFGEAARLAGVSVTWSAPVRYAEADQQGIVFNAHYLTYCDEAMAAYLAERDLLGFATEVRLVTSTLTWTGSARWGDVVEVSAECAAIGRTSLTIRFSIASGGRECCQVETVYVLTDADGAPLPIPDGVRVKITR